VVAVTMPDRTGAQRPITLGMPSLGAYEDPDRNQFLGDTVGRFANRIGGARFRLDGERYPLGANDGSNHLHGGPFGFGRRVWRSEPFVESDTAGVVFRYTSEHLEEGYPGRLEAACRTSLSESGVLEFEYEAVTDRPTIVGLTNHTYWNLNGEGTVHHHVLSIAAGSYLPVDAGGIPTAAAPAAVPPILDLRTPKRVGDVIDALVGAGRSGIDHCYLPEPTGGFDEPHAVLVDPESGRRLELWTDQPGIQCYTGQHLAGSGHAPYGGLCLESQRLPDAPNRPDFPSAVLRPGEVYRARTRLRLSVDR
jgi:aldose 1-epimerase